MSDMSSDRTQDPTRLVDQGGGAFSSMGSDLRAARSSGATYDVDAGLLKFSALVAAAPVAAVIGTSAAAHAAPAAAGAVVPGTVAAATTAVAGSAATSAAVTASTTAATSAGAAAKLAVAAKLGFGMKTFAAAVIATGAIGVAGYELASSPPSSSPREEIVAGDERTSRREDRDTRGPDRADSPTAPPAPVEAPRSLDAAPPTEPMLEAARPLVAPVEPPSSPLEARPEPAAVVAPTAPPSSAWSPPASRPAPLLAPTVNGAGAPTLRPEMEQLAKVRAAGDPSRQVKLAEEGHRLFPRGVFFQEREAIAIEALSRSGRTGEAAERARAYVARYPKSPYVEAFRRIADR